MIALIVLCVAVVALLGVLLRAVWVIDQRLTDTPKPDRDEFR